MTITRADVSTIIAYCQPYERHDGWKPVAAALACRMVDLATWWDGEPIAPVAVAYSFGASEGAVARDALHAAALAAAPRLSPLWPRRTDPQR